jgi:predicted Zn-dependent peptidase
VQYRVGSRDEVVGKTGYAHFFEHLMFEGTKDIERASIDKLIKKAGGTLNPHRHF